MQRWLIGLACAAVAGCGTTREMSYRADGMSADAQITARGKPLMIYVHPSDDVIMGQVTLGSAAASGFVTGLTWGIAKGRRLDPRDVDTALNGFVAPVGCAVDPVRQIGNEQVSYEGAYHCPPGIDLRSLVAAQRDALRRGQPLRRQ